MDKELTDLVGKVVMFNRRVLSTELDFEEGMKTRIKSIRRDDPEPDDNEFTCYAITCDFSEFVAHNLGKELPCYFDSEGKPTLKWSETAYYPSDHVTTQYMVRGAIIGDEAVFTVEEDAPVSQACLWTVKSIAEVARDFGKAHPDAKGTMEEFTKYVCARFGVPLSRVQ
jgi:hypothetical protein